MDYDMDILHKITQLKEERGWSSYRLAKEANIPQSTISNLYNRDNSPSLSTLISICDAFGITPSQFFSDITDASLTEDQNNLLHCWVRLDRNQKEKVMIYMKGLLQDHL